MREPHLRNGAAFSGLTIGLLGGSFNPAHEGHLEMSLHALRDLGVDQVWWLVSPQNPLKTTADMATLDRRIARAKRVAAHPRLTVTAIETELGTRYTADTLRALKRRFPRVRFVWLMGADNLRQMPRWKAWPDIFRLVPVAVFRRPAYAAGRGMGQAAIKFDRAWRRPARGKNLAYAKTPAWIILDNKLNYTSATK
ncbi:MAG: nicotinate-nucleotide adenylyltransferase, partial [Alphaproteobacteria bacterium]